MTSPNKRYDQIFISNYALLNVLDELKRTPGVGDASLFGARDYSMRIWLRPDKLAQYNMTPDDLAVAIREQNSQFAAGAFGQEPMKTPQAFTYTVTTQGRLVTPAEFENIILRTDANGATLRLKDVARVELGAQDYSFAASYNGEPSVGIGIYLQPGANALSTTTAVRARMEELGKKFPEGLAYQLPFDTTKFVEISIEEVVHTFIEAILLVVLVVFLFLQNFRATLIPLLAVPVSLIGTFAGMYMLGFSINLLTLFGLVLSIGIVVDDAIVVLENVERIMSTEGLSPRAATIKAMEEVTGPIIAIVLVLCAVFVPVGFMGGLTGEMYKQFAITIAVSVVISGFVALTLTPALCALLIKPHDKEHQKNENLMSRFFDKFNNGFDKVTNAYTGGVRFLMANVWIGLIAFAAIVAFTVFAFTQVPPALVPEEDQGYVIVMPILMPGASLSRTQAVMAEMTNRLMKQPEMASVISFAGMDFLSGTQKTSAGISFARLKDWSERKDDKSQAKNLTGRFMGMMGDIKDSMTLSFNPPPITGISLTGGFEGYIQSRAGGDIKALSSKVNEFLAAAGKRPELVGLQTTFNGNVPQYYVDLDRQKAKALGVPVASVFSAMQSTFGSYYINDFNMYGRVFRVSLQSEAEFREKPEDLRYVFVRSTTGNMIPLDTLVHVSRVVGPDLVERFNVFPSAKIMGSPAPGFSSGQALAAV